MVWCAPSSQHRLSFCLCSEALTMIILWNSLRCVCQLEIFFFFLISCRVKTHTSLLPDTIWLFCFFCDYPALSSAVGCFDININLLSAIFIWTCWIYTLSNGQNLHPGETSLIPRSAFPVSLHLKLHPYPRHHSLVFQPKFFFGVCLSPSLCWTC